MPQVNLREFFGRGLTEAQADHYFMRHLVLGDEWLITGVFPHAKWWPSLI